MDRIGKQDVEFMYRATDQGHAQPAEFTKVCLAYATCEPSAVQHAAQFYHSEASRLGEAAPIGDVNHVSGLYQLALAQPPVVPAVSAVATAIGLAALSESELGKATPQDRYLVLHGAALTAQELAASIGRSFVAERNASRAGGPLVTFGPWLVPFIVLMIAYLFFD